MQVLLGRSEAKVPFSGIDRGSLRKSSQPLFDPTNGLGHKLPDASHSEGRLETANHQKQGGSGVVR